MPQRPLRVVLLLGGLALLVLLCRVLGLGELRAALARADPLRFAAFLALSGAVFVVYGLRWRVVLRAIDPTRPAPPLATLVALRAAEHAVSTLLPSAHLSGEPVRALLLRRRGRDWPVAISSVTTDRLLDLSASAIVGPAYVAVFFFANRGSAWAAPWVMGGMIVCIIALAAFYVRAYGGATSLSVFSRRGLFPSLRRPLEAIEQNVGDFVRSPGFVRGLGLAFLAEALVLAEMWMLARAFELPISLATLVGVMVGMGIAQLLPVPGAVGSLEATEVGILTLAGGGAPLGLAVGLLVRVRETLWILVGLGALYFEGISWTRLDGGAEPAMAGGAAVRPKS